MASVTSDASFFDGLPDEATESGGFDTEDEGLVSTPLSDVPARAAAVVFQPAPALPTVRVTAPVMAFASPVPLACTASSSDTTVVVPGGTGGMPSWEEFLHVTKTSLVTTHTMMQQAAQVIVRLDQRQDRMEQNQDQLRQQLEQQQEQLGQLRTQLTQNLSRRPDGELSRDLLMLVEFIVRYGMDTKRGHVVAFPVMAVPRAGAAEKLFLAICTPLVHEAFMVMFKDKADKFKNKTAVNDMLNDLNHQQLTVEHRFLDKLLAHLELKRNMPLKKVFVLADVRYFFSAWQSVQGREQLPTLSALDLRQLSFARNQRSVWTDEAETHWASHDAKFLTKMAWNLPVQREVLVAHKRAIHAFMLEILTLQERASEWRAPESEVFHFCGFSYVSPHEAKVKKAVALLPRGRHDYSSSSSSGEEESGGEEAEEAGSVGVASPRARASSPLFSGGSVAGAGAPVASGKEYAVLMRQQKQQKRRRSKAKSSKRRKEHSSSDADDRLRASRSSSESSDSSEFEDTKTSRRKKHRK